jgi:type II secretory pathway pseudopilin PulG
VHTILICKQSGQTLISTLISVAIAGIVVMVVTSMLTYQNRESQALAEKLGARDLEQALIVALADGSVCQYVLNQPSPLTFDSTQVSPSTPQTITLPGTSPALYASINPGPPPTPGPVVAQVGQAASSYSNTLMVNSIKLSVVSGGGGTFIGNWIVGFDSTKTVRPLKPAMISTILIADVSAPAAATIKSCAGNKVSFATPIGVPVNSVQTAPCDGFVTYYTGGNGITAESAYFCQGTDSAKVSECYGIDGSGPGAQTIFSRIVGYNGSMGAVKRGYFYQVQYLGPTSGGGGLYGHGTPMGGVVARLVCLDIGY